MPSTFAELADQRKVAMQEGDVRHSPGTASPAVWAYWPSSVVGFKDKSTHALTFPPVITKAVGFYSSEHDPSCHNTVSLTFSLG